MDEFKLCAKMSSGTGMELEICTDDESECDTFPIKRDTYNIKGKLESLGREIKTVRDLKENLDKVRIVKVGEKFPKEQWKAFKGWVQGIAESDWDVLDIIRFTPVNDDIYPMAEGMLKFISFHNPEYNNVTI